MSNSSRTEVPPLITYQGLLTDSTGAPLANGAYSIQFQMYDAASAGNVLWSSGSRQINVTDGLFSYNLGDTVAFPDSLFLNYSDVWLGVKVGDNPEMTPRTKLVSSAYAIKARHADTAGFAHNVMAGSFLPLSGGNMSGAITSSGDPSITMGKGNFGSGNTNAGSNAFVAGENNFASGDYSTVFGGLRDTASGDFSTVTGGQHNTASGLLSFAAGSRAKALHDYSFVWGTSTLIDFASTAERQFLILASGGVGIGTNSPTEQLDITNPNTSANSVVRTNRANTFVANGLTLATAGVNKWSLRQPPTSTDNLSIFNHNLGLEAINFDLTNNNVGIGTTTPTARVASYYSAASAGNVIAFEGTALNSSSGPTYGGRFSALGATGESYGLHSTVSGSGNTSGLYSQNYGTGTINSGVFSSVSGVGASNFGVEGYASNGTAGNVGILGFAAGTNAFAGRFLNAKVGIGGSGALNIVDGDGDLWVGDELEVDGVAAFASDVGIGTISPAGKLHVEDVEWDSAPVRIKGLAGAVIGPSLDMDATDGTNGESYSIISTNSGAGAGGGKFTVYHNGPSPAGYRLVIENDGDVGIGTTSPSSRLHLREDLNAATGLVIDNQDPGSLSATALFFNSEDGSFQPQIVVFDGSHATNPSKMRFVNNLTGGNFDFLTAGLTRMIIENGGDVGIGTSTPVNQLDVEGAVAIGAVYSGTSTAPANGLIVQGNVGIGTTTPQNELDVEGSAAIGTAYSGTNAAPANGLLVEGLVGIGTSTPNAKLDVEISGTIVARFNRTSNDGIMLQFLQDGNTEGTISVAGTTVSYNAFTGSHYGWTDESLRKGELVTLSGNNQRHHNNPESEIIYGIRKSSLPNDPACLGSYLALSEPEQPYSVENPHLIMAVGNGEMWVTDESSDIKPGDYLISSSTPGHAMKDDEEKYPIGHIVARAAESVDWSSVVETIDGRKHKKISVLFGNFVRSDVAELRKTISIQQKQLNEQNDRITRLEANLLRSQIDN
jgi:hypothetical protein